MQTNAKGGLSIFMQTAAKLQQREQIRTWEDVFFSEQRDVGFMAVLDLEKPNQPHTRFFKRKDLEQLIAETTGKPDRYISLNAFNRFSRKSEYVTQLRTIAIDVDQYKKGLTHDDVMRRVYYLVAENKIPMPNLVLKSRGVQLFYSIHDGASYKMAWLTKYVTRQITGMLEDHGADYNAIDPSRVFRVPYSINSRNNSLVTPEILYNQAYSLDELRAFFPEVKRYTYKPKADKQKNVVPFRRLSATNNYAVVNVNRAADIEKLIEIRNGDMTGCRNAALYVYCFHASQSFSSYEALLSKARKTFSAVYTTDSKQARCLTESEIERTAKSAFEDGKAFKHYLAANGYKIRFMPNDGVIKPLNSKNLIEKLGITVAEQEQLKSIVNESIRYERKNERDKQRKAAKRRAEGMQTMSEYNEQRATGKAAKLLKLAELKASNPGATQRQLAEMMGMSLTTVNRLLKEIA